MSEIVYLSEEEFFQWLKIQLEKRESGSGRWKEKDKLKDTLYEILFCEQGLTVEDIEFAFIPFGQGGYLTIRQKFEILLYALEREYGSSLLFFTGVNKDYTMTEDDVNDLYFQWMQEERLFFSDEEKKAFFVQNLMEKRREKYEAAADIVIVTDGKSEMEICEEVIQRLLDEEKA